MNRFLHALEEMFAAVAMAEVGDLSSLGDDLEKTAETFECTNVDVALAEEGAYTASVCPPSRHTSTLAAHA
ncbi:MAG: hypothetical protein AB1634_17010 [Thermodesulfobacteriota bacterium]